MQVVEESNDEEPKKDKKTDRERNYTARRRAARSASPIQEKKKNPKKKKNKDDQELEKTWIEEFRETQRRNNMGEKNYRIMKANERKENLEELFKTTRKLITKS